MHHFELLNANIIRLWHAVIAVTGQPCAGRSYIPSHLSSERRSKLKGKNVLQAFVLDSVDRVAASCLVLMAPKGHPGPFRLCPQN